MEYAFDSTDSIPVKTYVRAFNETLSDAFGVARNGRIEVDFGMPSASIGEEAIEITDCRHGALYTTLPALAEEVGHVVANRVDGREHGGTDDAIIGEMLGNLGRGYMFEDNLAAIVDTYDRIADDIDRIAAEEQVDYVEGQLEEYRSYLASVEETAEAYLDDEADATDLHGLLDREDRFRQEIDAAVGDSVITQTYAGDRVLETGAASFFESEVSVDGMLRDGEVPDVAVDQLATTACRKQEQLASYDRDGLEQYMERQGYAAAKRLENDNADYDAAHVVGRALAQEVLEADEGLDEVVTSSNEELRERYGDDIRRLKDRYWFV